MRICVDTIKLISLMSWQNKETGRIEPLRLWPKQQGYLDFIHQNKFAVYLKRRQALGTTLTGADTLCQAELISGFLTLLLSKSGKDAIEFLKRIKTLYKSWPKEIRKSLPLICNGNGEGTNEELEFENGSRIISLPATRGEGFTSDRLVIDEAARIIPSLSHTTLKKVLLALEPVIRQADGQIILLSKASGFTAFRDYFYKGERKVGSIRSYFIGAYDDPNFTAKDRDELIKMHGEDDVNENYPRTPKEAFLMSGRCRFNRTVLSEMEKTISEPETGFLEEVNGIVRFNLHPEGWLKVWRRPSDMTEVFALGGDTAEGLADNGNDPDYSTACVVDRNAKQVAEIQCRLEPDVFEVEVRRLGKFYNNALAGIERNKDGLGVLKALKNNGYPNIYSQEDFDPDKKVKVKKLGWITDKITKPQLVSYADQLIREEKVTVKSNELLTELVTYVIFEDGSTGAEEGCHDDLVMAFLIALWMLKYVPEKNVIKPESDGYPQESITDKQLQDIRGY